MAQSIGLVTAPSSDSINHHRYCSADAEVQTIQAALARNDFRTAIAAAFHLPTSDHFVYHAIASVTLRQVQSAVDAGAANGLCDWYVDHNGKHLGLPPLADIDAYISTFAPTAHPSKSLTSFASNAKKSSLRASIAEHLVATRFIDSTLAPPSSAKKKKKKPASAASSASNPALFFWAWTCRALHWAGPLPPSSPTAPPRSLAHPTLPILMHHFGCVIPSPEAVTVLAHLAGSPQCAQGVADVGSGTGYWTAVLRAAGVAVTPIDNSQSEFRACWVPDTVHEDGAAWLRAHDGGRGHVLLMVYPVVGGDFVKRMMDAFEGATVAVAGAQDRSGYTAFWDCTFGEWMEEGERRQQGWRKMAQVALPGWQGKDEALYVYQKGEGGDEGGGSAIQGPEVAKPE